MTRYRYRRWRHRRVHPAAVAACAGVVLFAVGSRGHVVTHGHTAAGGPARGAAASGAAAQAVAYARARVNVVPYVFGGTTDAGIDCSGLTMDAWGSAGVRIERTSQEQWESEEHVTSPQPGDDVFFAGGDGTTSAPGHVGIVVNPKKHLMIDAYVPGTYVRYDFYGLPSSAPGLAIVVGFTNPGGSS
jgi:cell wall-associated NlpC family hydrolase